MKKIIIEIELKICGEDIMELPGVSGKLMTGLMDCCEGFGVVLDKISLETTDSESRYRRLMNMVDRENVGLGRSSIKL